MHRIEALSRQRGKGDTPPVDRKSPYFGHLRLEENGKRRDVLIGARSFVEPGGGVQIVDWRNAPVSRLFYRYEEGDAYEERLGDRLVEGEVLARRTVAIVDGELRRVASPQGTFSRDLRTGAWREIAARQARLQIARDGSAAALVPATRRRPRPACPPSRRRARAATRGKLGLDENGARRPDRHLPAIAALIDPRQFELITQPASGLIAVQGSAGSGKTTIGLHRIAYLAFADPRRFRPDKMLVIVYQRALAAYVSRVLPSLDVPGVPVMTFGNWAEAARRAAFPLLDFDLTDETPPLVMRAKAHGAFLRIIDDRQAALGAWCRDAPGRRSRPARRRPPRCWRSGTARPGPSTDASPRSRSGCATRRSIPPPATPSRTPAARCARARATSPASGPPCSTDRAALGEGFARHAPGRLLARPARRRSPLVRRARAAAHPARPVGRLERRRRGRTLRARRRGRGAPAAHLPAPARPHPRRRRQQDDARLRAPDGRRGAGLLAARAGGAARHDQRAALGDAGGRHGAGDRARARLLELGRAARLPGIAHERVEPLRVSYRSTREIVDAAEHVLGPLMGDVRPVAPRAGAPVEAFPSARPARAPSSCRTRSRS